jgi:hypothetical protein
MMATVDQHSHDLAALRREHPSYRIDREPHCGSYRYAATALGLWTSPWCVVTRDPAELRSVLTASPLPAAQTRHGS